MKVEDVPEEWRQVARVAFTKAFASTDGTCALDAALAAVIPAIQAEALERAAVAGRKAWPKAHTYASENADMYRAQDHAVETVLAAIRALKEGT